MLSLNFTCHRSDTHELVLIGTRNALNMVLLLEVFSAKFIGKCNCFTGPVLTCKWLPKGHPHGRVSWIRAATRESPGTQGLFPEDITESLLLMSTIKWKHAKSLSHSNHHSSLFMEERKEGREGERETRRKGREGRRWKEDGWREQSFVLVYCVHTGPLGRNIW